MRPYGEGISGRSKSRLILRAIANSKNMS